MQNVIQLHPLKPREKDEETLSRAAVWVVDALAKELAADPSMDRKALVGSLSRHAGYEQADDLLSDAQRGIQAGLVSRLAGRLARD